MFRVTVCACLALWLAGPAALAENKNNPPPGPWAGTFRDAQVTLELKAKADDRLNEHDPGRYIQIPLKDELFPLPEQPKR